MPGCCGLNIVQLNTGGAPFTFSVTGGNSPYNGGLGVITGPLVVNSGDILHLFSANTIDFNVTPGSVNIGAEVRLDPNPLNTITVSAAGLLSLGGSTVNNPTFVTPQTWDFSNNDWTINNIDDLIIDSNTISFNAPSICFTGITQNDALTRFMVMSNAGCISWRDVSTLPGAGGGISNIVSLRSTVQQTLPNNVETQLDFDVADIDTASIATLGIGTTQITIATTGIYEITSVVMINTVSNARGQRTAGIKVNGTRVHFEVAANMISSPPWSIHLNKIINLTAGDIVTLYAQHAAGALVTTFVNFAFEASSLFQLKKIG